MTNKKEKHAKIKTVRHFEFKQISTLNAILEKRDAIKAAYEENQSTEKRRRLAKSNFIDVDEELYAYFSKMRSKKAEIYTLDLKSKALEIAIGKGYHHFKARYNIQFKEMYGDAGSVDSLTTTSWFDKLSNMIKNYDDKDIYNLDETGLFYKAEKGKSFVTMSGEKLSLLVIGKSIKPYCFRHVRYLPTLYRSQSSSWMDVNIFLEY